MRFTPLQLIQLKQYTDTCVALAHFIRTNTGRQDKAYWSERADLEEDKRNKFAALESSLTWAADTRDQTNVGGE